MHVVIIGAGPAGITTAGLISDSNSDAKCTVVTKEDYPPYSPPLMFDHFINGFDIFWKGISSHKFTYSKNTSVIDVNFKSKIVTTADGNKLSYDKLIIASGASLYAPIRGMHFSNVYNFKSLTDASILIKRARSANSPKVVVIGAGFIGLEIALLLSKLHAKVTILERAGQVLPSAADVKIASKVQDFLQQMGIRVLLNIEAKEFKGQNIADEAVFNNGETVKADFFVTATGIRPQIDFLRNTSIRINRGICVDRYLRTSVDSVYAIGDCAEYSCSGDFCGSINHSFLNAIEQAQICASNVLGSNIEYNMTHKINSIKHISVPVIIAGSMSGEKHTYSKNDELRIVYVHNNRINGFQLFNSDKSAGVLTSLMKSSREISSFIPYIASPKFNHSFTN